MPAEDTRQGAPGPFIESALALVSKTESDASITSLVSRSMEALARGGPSPSEYFRVTDLVNPAAAFWRRRKPDVPEPAEIARRMAYGKVMHERAGYWLSQLPEFVLGEGRIEGGYVGLSGITGKLDFLLHRSVLEYKTKTSAPEDPASLWDHYPQDVEQTLFYAALLPDASDDHFLAFDDGSAFRCFRLRIRDKGPVMETIRIRIRGLRRALNAGDPTSLGRCRYATTGCKFAIAGACGCGTLPPLDTEPLRRVVEVVRDPELEKALRSAHKDAAAGPEEIWWWELLAPRRRFLEDSPTYSSPVWKNACRWLLQEAVRGVRELRVDRADYAALRTEAAASGLHAPSGLLLVRREGLPGGTAVVPYIARASQGLARESWQVPPYYVAELAVACGVARSPRGVIVVMYPGDSNKIVAYGVVFKDVGRLRDAVVATVDAIRRAEAEHNPGLLPKCPAFMQDGCTETCLCRPASGVA